MLEIDGTVEGALDGKDDKDGANDVDGFIEIEGRKDGWFEGRTVGVIDGTSLGTSDGQLLGMELGESDGAFDGANEFGRNRGKSMVFVDTNDTMVTMTSTAKRTTIKARYFLKVTNSILICFCSFL
jgi:hypothetical protein